MINLPDNLITYTIDISHEIDVSPEQSFDTGDKEQDHETCIDIYKEIDHNKYAWCYAQVTAHYKQFSAVDSLGAISCLYKYCSDPHKAFTEEYLPDMKYQAANNLRESLRQAYQTLQTLQA